MCVGQKVKDDDERVILFVKMKDGLDFTRDLVERLRSAVRQKLTARHVPAVIMQIADIPVSYILCKLNAYKYCLQKKNLCQSNCHI